MSIDFTKYLVEGSGKAEDIVRNKAEVDEVLNDLRSSLSSFLKKEIFFTTSNEIEESLFPKLIGSAVLGMEKPELTGFKIYRLKCQNCNSDNIFKLKMSDDIYPITLEFGRNSISISSKEDLIEALAEVMSNGQVHMKLNSFKEMINSQKAAE